MGFLEDIEDRFKDVSNTGISFLDSSGIGTTFKQTVGAIGNIAEGLGSIPLMLLQMVEQSWWLMIIGAGLGGIYLIQNGMKK